MCVSCEHPGPSRPTNCLGISGAVGAYSQMHPTPWSVSKMAVVDASVLFGWTDGMDSWTDLSVRLSTVV